MEISKELLSKIENYRVDYFDMYDNNITYYTNHLIGVDDNRVEENNVNIYELAHKCKNWAIEKGYCLRSCIHDNGSNERFYSICEVLTPSYDSSSLFDILHKTTEANTEIESIFKACQWILDNKEG